MKSQFPRLTRPNRWIHAATANKRRLLGLMTVLGASALVAHAEEKPAILTALSSTSLSGFIDTSVIWQIGDNRVDTARWLGGSDRQDGFNLNCVGLVLEKPVGEGEWGAGYKVEMLMGPDALASTGNSVGLHCAFVKLRAPVGNGLDFKLGLWPSISGYEYIESYKNPNYSHSYGCWVEPGRQTGLQASYNFTDWLNVVAGLSDAYTSGVNARPYNVENAALVYDEWNLTTMGAITLTAPESWGWLKGMYLYGTVIGGTTAPAPGATPYPGQDVMNYSLSLNVPLPVDGLSCVVAYDYVDYSSVSEPSIPYSAASSYAQAIALYTIYKPAGKKWSLANRLDYAHGAQGYFVPDTAGREPGGTDELLSETFTVAYDLWANVLLRGEFRYDHDLDPQGGAGAFGGEVDAYSLSMNVVYKF